MDENNNEAYEYKEDERWSDPYLSLAEEKKAELERREADDAERIKRLERGRTYWAGANMLANVLANAVNVWGTANGAPAMQPIEPDNSYLKMWKDIDDRRAADTKKMKDYYDSLRLASLKARSDRRNVLEGREYSERLRKAQNDFQAEQAELGRKFQSDEADKNRKYAAEKEQKKLKNRLLIAELNAAGKGDKKDYGVELFKDDDGSIVRLDGSDKFDYSRNMSRFKGVVTKYMNEKIHKKNPHAAQFKFEKGDDVYSVIEEYGLYDDPDFINELRKLAGLEIKVDDNTYNIAYQPGRGNVVTKGGREVNVMNPMPKPASEGKVATEQTQRKQDAPEEYDGFKPTGGKDSKGRLVYKKGKEGDNTLILYDESDGKFYDIEGNEYLPERYNEGRSQGQNGKGKSSEGIFGGAKR